MSLLTMQYIVMNLFIVKRIMHLYWRIVTLRLLMFIDMGIHSYKRFEVTYLSNWEEFIEGIQMSTKQYIA